jgi:hypothetical protein
MLDKEWCDLIFFYKRNFVFAALKIIKGFNTVGSNGANAFDIL